MKTIFTIIGSAGVCSSVFSALTLLAMAWAQFPVLGALVTMVVGAIVGAIFLTRPWEE